MSDPQARATYQVFARIEADKSTVLALGTVDAYRSGHWHVPCLRDIPSHAEGFVSAVFRAGQVSLSVALPAGDPLRNTLAGVPDGSPCTIEYVTEVTPPGASAPTVLTHTRTLSVSGMTLSGLTIQIRLVDLDEVALDELWPPHTWRPEDWPALTADDAGLAMPAPVGTALKLRCPLLDTEPAEDEWWYGVCTGTPVLLPVTDVVTASSIVRVSGDQRERLPAGGVLYWINVGGGAAGRYEIASSSFAGGLTTVTVAGTIPPGTPVQGSLRVMPQVLTVYRNGRVVPADEYDVVHCYAPYEVINGDFSDGLSGWSIDGAGTGSVTVVSGAAVIVSTNASNWREIVQDFSAHPDLFCALQVRCVSGVDARMRNPLQFWRRVSSGQRRTGFINVPGSTAHAVRVGAWQRAGTTTIDDIRLLPYELVLIRFRREQRDFGGGLYTIEADVRGVASRNAVTEIRRLLEVCDLDVDASSFASAESYATSQRMLVDCDYGRDGQRRIRAILDDLCFIARATLYRTAAGAYAIAQDRPAGALTEIHDDSDAVAVEQVDRPPRPKLVKLRYRPSNADPGRMQHTIERPILGGSQGEEGPRDVRYLRDHEAADRLITYLAARRGAGRVMRLSEYLSQRALGALVRVHSATLPSPGYFDGRVWRVGQIAQGARLELLEHDPDVYTWFAGPLPPDAVDGYEPDYSATPPPAPTAATVLAMALTVNTDGVTGAWIRMRAQPPALNWSELWMVAVHNVTGEIVQQRAEEVSTDVWEATLSGLRPGEVYQLRTYAVNAFGLRGPSTTSFDATAVGGGTVDTTITTPGLAAAPPNVVSITRQQGTGRLVNVNWPALTDPTVREYELERFIGFSGWEPRWRGRATSYVDRDVTYGTAYTYRVRAVDTWGNVSAAWTNSANITLSGNVTGGSAGDVGANEIASLNRTQLSTVAQVSGPGGSGGTASISHGLGRRVAVNASCTTGAGTGTYFVGGVGSDTSQVHIGILVVPPAFTELATPSGASHFHVLPQGAGTITVTAEIW